MNSQITKMALCGLATAFISGCAFTKWETRTETREKGEITYVSESTAQGKVLAIQSAELSPNGLLEISAHKFVYGSEYQAPLMETVTLSRKDPDPVGALLTTVVSFGAMVLKEGKELGRQTIGETKNERVTGTYIEKSRGKMTGRERWDSLADGTYEVTISSTRLDSFSHTFKLGSSSLNLSEPLSKIDGKKSG